MFPGTTLELLMSSFYYYLTDVDDDGVGTLKVYDGKKPAKIADDVYSFITNGDSNVAYLSDYDVEDSEGEAYLYNGAKEPKLIDRDVAQLIMNQLTGLRLNKGNFGRFDEPPDKLFSRIK